MVKHARFRLDPNTLDERQPWDAMDGEPVIWYTRFELFLRLGPTRNIAKLWRSLPAPRAKNPTPHWHVRAREWHWLERAAAYDMHQLTEKRRQFNDEAQQDKEDRIRIIKGARGKLVLALNSLDPTTAKFSEVFSALKIVMDELRNEYDDQPTQRHQLTENEADIAIANALAQLDVRRQAAASLEDREGIVSPFIDLLPDGGDEGMPE